MPKKTSKIKKASQLRKNATKNLSTFNVDGFTFVFDDKKLQEDYIEQWRYFNNLFKGKGRAQLPLPNKITYQDAVSLVRGKNQDSLTEIESIYNQMDYTWEAKGLMHKTWMFNEAIKESDGSQEIKDFIKEIDKYLDELAEQSGVSNIKGKKKVKYNIVYYGIKDGTISV